MDFLTVTFATILSMVAMGGNITEKPNEQIANVSTYILPTIVGQWQLDLSNVKNAQANCQERYNFARDQKFLGVSGQERTYGEYLFSAVSDGLPALAIQTQYDNNQVDCSGQQIDQTGDILVAYVKQHGNIMQWCSDSEGKKCEMTLRRILP